MMTKDTAMTDDDTPDFTSPRIPLTPQEPPRGGLSADPHDDPATRWESGPDGAWTIAPLWDGKPGWLRDDDRVKLRRASAWRLAGTVTDEEWAHRAAFFLRRRPQVDEGLVALIQRTINEAIVPDDDGWRHEAEAVARALLSAGWRKEGA